ncbi:MAG: hypothetical protein F4Z34_11380 [Acidimicrobiaceae bacterium]|nr:hypothetical protein [Acidimicrobiaceae bacterium]
MHLDIEDGFDLRLTEVGDDLPTASLGPLRIEHFCRYMFACGVPGPERDGGDVHYDMWAAARAGFNDVFDMGAWRTALFVELAENQWGGPHTRVTKIRNRYGGMVYRDDTLRFCGRVAAKETTPDGSLVIDVDIWNDIGSGPPVTTGEMTLRVPPAG